MYVTTKHWLDDLLPRLETQWVEQNAPIANHLQRGLTDEQVAAIEAALEVPLPAEVKLLWQWHDGTDSDNSWDSCVVVGGWQFLSSAQALAMRSQRLQANGRPYPEPDPDEWEGDWHPAWLPIAFADACVLFVDVRQASQGGTVSVRRHDWCPDDPFTPVVGSIAALLAVWVDVLEKRYEFWAVDGGGIDGDPDAIPLGYRVMGVC
ncbi:MAG: hypothetical protein QOG99_2145 [Frankiales bacterium]|jgi:cell wall assembly regulator SMI1|nr:hypothetical protein [Frankiales bacterium]